MGVSAFDFRSGNYYIDTDDTLLDSFRNIKNIFVTSLMKISSDDVVRDITLIGCVY